MGLMRLNGNDAGGNHNVLDIDKFWDDNHIPKNDASHKDISLNSRISKSFSVKEKRNSRRSI